MNKLLNLEKLVKDEKGIYLVKDSVFDKEIKISKEAWEEIFNYDLERLTKEREDFDKNKLADHVDYIERFHKFTKDTIYLEIGCGPAHIGEYVLRKYGCTFVGIDFNYAMLVTLKQYFDKMGYSNYILICGDINSMPLVDNSVDFIYGGGVIEHFADTKHILKESYRVLKPGGVSFNTVPAFSMWWLTRFFSNIPAVPILRQLFETLHLKLLKGRVLHKFFGYELSFTPGMLKKYHKDTGYKSIVVLPFAFHPSSNKLRNAFLRGIYFRIQKSHLSTAIYLVVGEKS